MNSQKIKGIVVLSLFLSGCASVSTRLIRDQQGNIVPESICLIAKSETSWYGSVDTDPRISCFQSDFTLAPWRTRSRSNAGSSSFQRRPGEGLYRSPLGSAGRENPIRKILTNRR